MKLYSPLLLTLATLTVQATEHPAPPFNQTANFGVYQAFSDLIDFSVPASGSYTPTVRGLLQHAGCARFHICGDFRAVVTSVELQTQDGALVAQLPNSSPAYGAFTLTETLAPGNYRLQVQGYGAGTIKYVGYGNYSVEITAPVIPVTPSCDYERDLLQSQGYTETQVEAMVAALQAQTPPGCTGD